MPTTLKPGDAAPAFEAPSWDGSTVRLSDFAGNRNVALYFYVRDNTSGCTRQARSLRDAVDELDKRDTTVIGVSTDDLESHKRFATNNELNFPLLSDTDGKIAGAYGVLRETGRAERATFLIGKDGSILHVWPKVEIAGHAHEIMAKLDELVQNPARS
jgi:peroxiredoxin Q/BCP